MKLFIAVPVLEDETCEFLSRCSQRLRRYATAGTFVPAENFHVTILYIGETERIADLAAILDEATRSVPPFDLLIDEFGMFAAKGLPTAWVGGASVPLAELHNMLMAELKCAGFCPDQKKDYHPHITLARKAQVRSPQDPSLTDMVLGGSSHRMPVSQLTLFSSESIRGKRIYRSIHDAALRGEGAKP